MTAQDTVLAETDPQDTSASPPAEHRAWRVSVAPNVGEAPEGAARRPTRPDRLDGSVPGRADKAVDEMRASLHAR